MTEAEHTNKTARSPVHWLRWLLLALALILGIPLVLLVALFLALRSETGTEWVIDQIPGLTVEAGQGSLFGQWQAQSLHWRGYGVDLQVAQPDIDWSPTCLFEKTVCLDRLHATSIVMTVQPGEDSGDSGLDSLPSFALPVTAQIRDIRLGPFRLNDNLVWDQLSLAATGSGSDWQLEALNYQRNEIDLTLAGRVETRGDWPLDLSLTGQLPPPYGDQWSVDIGFRGSAEVLRFAGRSEGYLTGRIEGRTEPLNPALPARASLVSGSFRALDTLPETLTLNDLNLSLDGSLDQGFATRASASLPSTEGAMVMSLRGHLTTQGIDQLRLTLEAPSEGEAASGEANVDGSLSWQEQFAAEGQLALKAFPWYALLPDMEKPPVTVKTLDGEASYQGGDYQASLNATVDGPSGEAELKTRVTGDHQKLSLTGLSLSSGAGGMTGEADIGFDRPLNWDAQLALEGFDPGYWVPLLSADLDGSLESRGQMTTEGVPELQVEADLQGSWRDHPARMQLSAGGSPGNWEVASLAAEVGGNQLTGQGVWRKELDGDFRLSLPEPGLFHPDLEGTLDASVSVAGTPAEPQGQARLSASELSWRGNTEIDSARLQADLEPGLKLVAELQANGVSAAGQTLDEVNLQLEGTREDHRLSLNVGNDEVALSLVLAGLFEESWDAWEGRVQEGTIGLPQEDMTWLLEQPAALAWQNGGSVTLAEHCWTMGGASVCAGDQRLYPDTQLSYVIRQFPSQALSPLLPEDLRWNTLLNADLNLALGEQGPDGQLSVDAGSGSLEVLAPDGWKDLDYERLSASLRLQPDRADLKLELAGSQIGELQADLRIDPMAAEKTVDGNVSLRELNLALVTAFTDLEQVEGKLEGQGRLSGPLLKPAINGELVLTGGQIQDGRLPMALDDMVATLTLEGDSAVLDGRWKSGERSSGTLDGQFEWQQGLAGELSLQADRLPFRYEPYARLELEPDLTMSFRDGDLSVQGRVGVPRGEIEVKELPEQAVSVSEDEVLVGVETEEPVVRKLDLNITVAVGDDRVSFLGFGITGDLEGVLRIGNDLDTRGSLRLVNGQYEAYGQELELRRARLVFDGPVGQPYLDIEAVRRVDTVVAGIRLTGPISSPRTEVFSEPSMPQSQALSYVILGRPLQGQGDEGQMSRAAISLGLTQTAGITREIGEEFGIRNLTLEAEGSGEESSVVAKGYLTDELSLRYGVGIFEPISTVALRYDLGRYFYLEAASGLAASLDIFYTRDF